MKTMVYTFEQDINQLHHYVDMLSEEFIPGNIERCQNKIIATVERICDNKIRSYVPIEVKQYFRTAEEKED